MSLHATKSAKIRLNNIAEANRNALHSLLPKLTTAKEKRELIAEKNPLLYLFGTVLDPKNYLINEENDHDLSI